MGVDYNIAMSSRRITCSITGKSYTYSQDYYDKKVKDYVDDNNLKKYFITQKAKTYLNKGYSIQEIRNILNVDEDGLPECDSQQLVELIEFHKIQASQTAKKVSNTLQQGSPTTVKIFEAGTGQLYRVITVGGNIVSQPYASGHVMTVTVESSGKRFVKTFSLPHGGLKSTIPV